MKKIVNYFLILLSIAFLTSCKPTDIPTEENEITGLNEPIPSFFAYFDSDFIYLDISEAYIEYAEENDLSYDDDEKHIRVKRIDTLEIVDQIGEPLSLNELQRGDIIYLEYDLATYSADNLEIERNKLVSE